MKRIFLILICIMLLGSLCIPALGESASTRTVSVQGPAFWETAYLWTGGADGESFTPTPELEMIQNGNLYQQSIADDLTFFTIIGNGTDTVGPISVEPYQDVLIIMREDGTPLVDYGDFTDGQFPTEPAEQVLQSAQSIYRVTGSSEFLGNWDPDNDQLIMTETGTGVYELVLKNLPAGEYFLCITENGGQDGYWEDNGAPYCLTMDRSGMVTVRFAIHDGVGQVEFIKAQEDNTADTRSLSIIVPDSWTTVNAYTWEPEDFGIFPGKVVQKTDGVYRMTVKKSMVNLVISGLRENGSRVQTSDIKLERNDLDVFVEVSIDHSHKVYYGSMPKPPRKLPPDDQGQPSEYRVVGNADWMGNWDPANELGVMNEVAPGIYRKTFYDIEPGSYELKITKGGTWDTCYGENGNNFTFTVLEKCSFTVEFTQNGDEHDIDVYGYGDPACDGDEDEEDIRPTRTPAAPRPSGNHNQGSWVPSMGNNDPTETTPQDTPSTDPKETKPQETEPVCTGDSKPKDEDPDPPVSSLPSEDPSGPDIEPPPETPPTHTGQKETDPSVSDDSQAEKPDHYRSDFRIPALVNQPISSPLALPFGLVAVFVYLLFLLARRNQVSGDITPEGTVRRRTRLSAKAVIQAVKEDMPTPPAKVDQAVLEVVQKTQQSQTET